MASLQEVLELCRLCLIKDDVNTPIFEDEDDISHVFLKLSACLPIKVSRDDLLPKRICESCFYKLELFYEFLKTCTTSEKQLLSWINPLKISTIPLSKSGSTILLKQEVPELIETDDLNIPSETQDYELQQPYEGVEFEFQQEEFIENESGTNVNEASGEKRKRGVTLETLQDDLDSDDDIRVHSSKHAKTEDDIDSDNDAEETFDEIPSTSGDNDQPGPSGVGKAGTDPPFNRMATIISDNTNETLYECEVCSETFASKNEFLAHHMNQFGQTFTCCRCHLECKTTTELYNHYELHKNNTIILENEDSTEYEYSEEVEISIPHESINETNEMVYILDGSQCVNEIVIEDENEVQEVEETEEDDTEKQSENLRILHVEHGYMLPSIFKGQLEAKRRYTRKESEVSLQFDVENNSQPEETTPKHPSYISIPKARPKRRHEVPDFSATSYIVLNPNEEIDMTHYKCLRCEQLFISKFTFFRHIEKGKCFVNSCDVCCASFEKNNEFYEHYLAEHTDRAICNFCFRTFMYEKNVKEHMLRHLDQFRHRCEECNKGFYTVREYRNHYKNRHMGIRHKCDVCGRSFADEYYFKRHVATHEKALKKNNIE